MSRAIRKVVSIILIITMIMTNAGLSTFAESIDYEKSEFNATDESGITKLSYENQETYAENNAVSENENIDNEKLMDNDEHTDNEEPEEDTDGSIEPEEDETENEAGSTESQDDNSLESSESSEESTTESSEENTTESSEESTTESSEKNATISSEESTSENITTTLASGENNDNIENEEKANDEITATNSNLEDRDSVFASNDGENIATNSNAEENVLVATDLEANENNKISTESDIVATDSDIIATDSELYEITVATISDFSVKTLLEGNELFGSLIDKPDNKKVNLGGNWWLNYGLNGIPKEEIKKIEFGKGIRINNRDWDILKVVDDGAGGKNYRLLSKENIGTTLWSWSGDGCRSYYAYPPYDDSRTGYHHDGAAPHKFLMNEFYPTFPDYYKNNMVLMNETEVYWSNGGTSRPTMKPLSTYIRIPVADEIDWFEDFTKLANGSNWWIMEHVHRADGVIGQEGAAVFPADGNYDPTHGGWSFTHYQRYSSYAGVRAVMTMKKDGLKLDPSQYNYEFPTGVCRDIINTDGDLLGFAYVINESYGYRLYIHMLYDDAIKVTNGLDLFNGFTNVTEIKGLDLVDFSNCTNMAGMFEGCSKLKTISYYDSSLNKLPSSFGQSNSNINSMFKGCKSLENLDFLPDGFSPRLTIMDSAFEDTKLSVWPNQIDTTHVMSMKRLFAQNGSQIFNFNDAMTAFIYPSIDVSEMFKDSESLYAITVDSNFVGLPANVTKSTDMFYGCINLVGGEGFRYKESMCDGKYARIDYGAIVPGYLACTDVNVYNNIDITLESNWKTNAPRTSVKKIVFTTENGLLSETDDGFEMPVKINGIDVIGKGFTMDNGETIIIHVSYKIGGFKTVSDWTGFFEGCTNVERFEGLDLIDTSNVTIMKDVFKNCSKLDTFNLDDFDIANVTSIESMFEGCKEFRGFYGTNSVFTSLQNASHAFKDCTSLRLIGFDMFLSTSLQDTTYMFENCTSLRSIMVDDNLLNFPLDQYQSENMFKNCTNIVGGQGTKYNTRIDPNGKNFANVDYGGIKPGYFTLRDSSRYANMTFTLPTDFYDYLASYMAAKSTVKGIKFVRNKKGMNEYDLSYYMSNDNLRLYKVDDVVIIHLGTFTPKIKFPADSTGLFKDFSGAIHIEGLENVDISAVTNMSEMFSGCTSLEDLNLLSFATNNVTDVSSMFKDDRNLRIIKASSSFAIRGVTGTDMFLNCDLLEGGEGTKFSDVLDTTSAYAFPDEGPTSANPGYFTWDNGIKFVYNLIYDGNGADGGTLMPKKEGCRENENVTLDANTYTRTNYKFIGWSDVSTATSEDWKSGEYWYDQDTFSYEPATQFEDKTIYAVWEKISYTITYNSNGANGGVLPQNQTGYSGDDLILRTNPGNLWKSGKYLVGWDENQSATSPIYTLGGKMNKTFTTNGTVTLYAIWGNVPYTIRLNPNGGVGDAIDIPAQSDIPAKLPNVSWDRSGYSLLAWNTDKNATPLNCEIVGEHYNVYGASVNKTFGANQANTVYNLYAIWEENSTPSPSPSGGNGGSSSGGGGGPRLEINKPNTTVLSIIKANATIVVDDTKTSWRYDPNSDSFKLNIEFNGEKVPVSNVFVVINNTNTQKIISASNQVAVSYTYCFDQKNNMLTGWVGTLDNKWYFFENAKTSLEGTMIIGWKEVQGEWYYFTSDGEMLTNAMTPDGYMVGADGKWVKGK